MMEKTHNYQFTQHGPQLFYITFVTVSMKLPRATTLPHGSS